jgi:hypothetical protein
MNGTKFFVNQKVAVVTNPRNLKEGDCRVTRIRRAGTKWDTTEEGGVYSVRSGKARGGETWIMPFTPELEREVERRNLVGFINKVDQNLDLEELVPKLKSRIAEAEKVLPLAGVLGLRPQEVNTSQGS